MQAFKNKITINNNDSHKDGMILRRNFVFFACGISTNHVARCQFIFHENTFSKIWLLALTPYLVTRLFFYVGFVYFKYLDQQENTSIFVYIECERYSFLGIFVFIFQINLLYMDRHWYLRDRICQLNVIFLVSP